MTRPTRQTQQAITRAIAAITTALEDFENFPLDSSDRRKLLTTIQNLEDQRDRLT